LVRLTRKKGIFLSSLNCVLKALILELKDYAEALVLHCQNSLIFLDDILPFSSQSKLLEIKKLQ